MRVPFVDLTAQYNSLRAEIDEAIRAVISDCAFIGGTGNKYVQSFEANFGSYLGLNNVVACANGTDAIEIALEAMGIGQGDEVIVPACSWFSTAEAVSTVGAKPVFVDVLENSLNINPALIEEKINAQTKAIIPVHLYGAPANMPEIMTIAEKHNLLVLEDCAQAHGAKINNRTVGTFGHIATFSFYPGKNLGAYGDAGAICTNDEKLAQTCRVIAQHGQLNGKHNHIRTGRNSRLDGIQAAILDVKLPHLNNWISARRTAASHYFRSLSQSVKHYQEQPNEESVYHLFVVQVENRQRIMQQLKENNVDCAIHYPTPLPLLKPYRYDGVENEYPVANSVSTKILSLPIYPEITKEQIEFVSGLTKQLL